MNKKITLALLSLVVCIFSMQGFTSKAISNQHLEQQEATHKIYEDWSIVEKNASVDQWQEISQEDLLNAFGQHLVVNVDSAHPLYANSCGVRKIMKYASAHSNPYAKPIALFVVHGTFAANAADYFDKTFPLFEATLNLGKELAERYRTRVEVISYKWTGYNTQNDRQVGGQILAQIIGCEYFNGYSLYTYAHSHGGNVVNYASRLLGNSEWHEISNDEDGVTVIEGLPENRTIDTIINVATPIVYAPENFKNLLLFYSTGDLVQSIGAFQLGMQYDTRLRRYVIPAKDNVGYRNIGYIKNIRTQVCGEDPDHSALNAYVMFELPIILTKLQSVYKHNSDLDLNIDQNQVSYNKALLTIRRPLSKEFADNVNSDELEAEQNYSISEKARFTVFYNKDIEEKSSIFLKINNLKKTMIGAFIPNFASYAQTHSKQKNLFESLFFRKNL